METVLDFLLYRYYHKLLRRDAGTSVRQGVSKKLRAMKAYEKQKKSLPTMLATVQQQY